MENVTIAIAGTVIVLLTASDIFQSLLVPRAVSVRLRVGPALNRLLFAAWQFAAEHLVRRDARQTMRASLAPLLLVLNLMAWAGLLILGFGLIFWADRANFRPGFVTLGDALYAAGSAFSTLGIDGHVDGVATRTAVLICSVSGLAVVTVVATFLISIQTGFARRETLVLRLESHVTLPPAGIAILETYAKESITRRLGAFFEAWELWATDVAISHRAFPILILFRSNDYRCEWLAAFGAVLDAAALLDATVKDPAPEAEAGAHFVLRTGARVLGDMAAQFTVPQQPPVDAADRERFHAHRERLADAGYTLVEDEKAALNCYVKLRQTYAASLAALGRRLHIAVDERTGDDVDSEPQG